MKIKPILRIAAAITALLMICAALGSCSLRGAGADRLRRYEAVSSKNVSVDGAMMAYIFFTTGLTMASHFTDKELAERGFDPEKKLNEQIYEGDSTWFDFFMGEAKTEAARLIVLNEEAKARGISLSDKDLEAIENTLYQTRVNIALYYSLEIDEYLKQQYKGYVAEQDIRAVYCISALASQAADRVNGEIAAGITEADIAAYGENLTADKHDTTLTRLLGMVLLNSDIYQNESEVTPLVAELQSAVAAGTSEQERLAAYRSFAEKYDVSGTSLYENVAVGDMTGYIDEWIYADGRKIGDVGIVKSDYGYHILYYAADDDPVWVANAKIDIHDERYDKWFADKLAELNIKYNEDVIYAVDY